MLFFTDDTLAGEKIKVYVLEKAYKKVTGAKVTSYEIKFALENMLRHEDKDNLNLGEAMKKVVSYYNLEGKFNGVAEHLQKRGVTEIEITSEGFWFKGFRAVVKKEGIMKKLFGKRGEKS